MARIFITLLKDLKEFDRNTLHHTDMKTYTDILYEVIESDFKNVTPITEGLRIRVAKAYAKQWLDELAKALNKNQGYGSVHPEYILEDIKKKIDQQ